MLVGGTVPTLLNGVSQQPYMQRLPSQCEEQINAVSDRVVGLSKRPPFMLNAKVAPGQLAINPNMYAGVIHRSPTESYLLMVDATGKVGIRDTSGNVINYVDDTNGAAYAYLASSCPRTSIRSLTIGDLTFLLNRDVTTQMTPDRTGVAGNGVYFIVTAGNYGTTYTISLNGVKFSYTTSTTSVADIAPANIMAKLLAAAPPGTFTNGTDGSAPQYHSYRQENVLYVIRNDGKSFNYGISDSGGNRDTKAVSGTLADPSDLPPFALDGTILKIKNSEKESGGYYMRFNATAAVSDPDTTVRALSVNGIATASYKGTDPSIIFDGKTNTIFSWPWTTNGPWVCYQFSSGAVNVVQQYILYSGDTAGKDPKSWRLQGSDDGVNWVTLDTRTNIAFPARYTPYTYTIANPQGFNRIRLVIDAVRDSSLGYVHVCELTLIGVPDVNASVFGSGEWDECVGFSQQYRVDADTMPMCMVHMDDGWHLQWAPWVDRATGADNLPSFIGNSIQAIFTYRNRLGVLSDTHLFFSRSGDYFNHWPKTAMSVLDDDPIDLEATADQVTTLRNVTQIGADLVIFGDQAQYMLKCGDTLTPSSASLVPINQYDADVDVKPVSVGEAAYFTASKNGVISVFEYVNQYGTNAKEANSISTHVPTYLQGNAKLMALSRTADVLLVVPTDPGVLYINEFTFQQNERVQNSWSKWTFDSDTGASSYILSAEFINSVLDLLVVRTVGSTSELFKLQVDFKPRAYRALLDYRISSTTFPQCFTFAGNQVAISPNYAASGNVMMVVAVDASANITGWALAMKVGSQYYATLTVPPGGSVVAGIPYTMTYQFSPFQVRTQNAYGSITGSAIGRLQVRRATVSYGWTWDFKVSVTNGQGPTVTRSLGAGQASDGSFMFLVNAQNTQAKIVLTSGDCPFPCSFQSAEWEGEYVTKSRKI